MILVTGATGFLGAELCKQLTVNGNKITALKRATSTVPKILEGNPLINWVNSSLEDHKSIKNALNGVTKVYHCAALVSFNPADAEKLYTTNIDATTNLVKCCIEKNIRLLHVSSVATLGDADATGMINEACWPEITTIKHAYGLSKYKGELAVWEGFKAGLNGVIVNPSVIIGPDAGFKRSGSIFKLVKDGLKFYTAGVSGFVDVADVALSMVHLMESDISGQRFIISSENYCYKDFFAEIASGFGIRPPTIEATPWMLGIAWRAAKLASFFTNSAPALTRDSAKSSFSVSYYDNQKIKEAIGINFIPVKSTILETTTRLKNFN